LCSTLLCSYGPRQTSGSEFSEKGKLQCEFKFATFSCKDERRKYQQDKEERDYSLLMVQALEVSVIVEKFPKSVIDVYVTVIESDGSALSAAITCASMALADAGIEMYDLVVSCSVVRNLCVS
jgi:exosome complex component MTR3